MPSRLLALTPDLDAFRSLAEVEDVAAVEVHADLAQGLASFNESDWTLVLLDGAFAGGSGEDLLRRMTSARPDARVVMVTRDPTVSATLAAVERGARDVLAFPPDPAHLRGLLVNGGAEPRKSPLPLEPAACDGEMVGRSPAMLRVFRDLARVADSSATVLLEGESGTGKELVARALHRSSSRRDEPFVAVNCAAIPEALLESELFGHEKGAFTGAISRRRGRFERADGGTLFLDEVGDMSLALQGKILRALEEREVERVGGSDAIGVDVRIVAATNRTLGELVESGRFREDLYYRLSVVPLSLPPLRERGDDVLLLARHFGAHSARRHRRDVNMLARAAGQRLGAHRWPGNVRELRNVMERAVLLADGGTIHERHLPTEIRAPEEAAERKQAQGPPPLDASLDEVEAAHIRRVFRHESNNLTRASEVLGIHRNTLRRKLRKYEIPH